MGGSVRPALLVPAGDIINVSTGCSDEGKIKFRETGLMNGTVMEGGTTSVDESRNTLLFEGFNKVKDQTDPSGIANLSNLTEQWNEEIFL